MNHFRPLAETPETVTLSRRDYEALIAAAEDRIDHQAIDEQEAAPCSRIYRSRPASKDVLWAGFNGPIGSLAADPRQKALCEAYGAAILPAFRCLAPHTERCAV